MSSNNNDCIDMLFDADYAYRVAMGKLNIAVDEVAVIGKYHIEKSYDGYAKERCVTYKIKTLRGLDDGFDAELCDLINKHLKKNPRYLPALILTQ